MSYSIDNEANTHLCVGCSQTIDRCQCIWGNFRELYQLVSKIQEKVDYLDGMAKASTEAESVLFKRIEECIKLFAKDTYKLEKEIDVLEERIKKLEDSDYDERINDLENIGAELRLCSLEPRIKEIERFQDITREQYKLTIKRKHPHKCPVCEGSLKVLTEIAKHDFDGTMRAGLELSRKCHSCEGKGIVWG